MDVCKSCSAHSCVSMNGVLLSVVSTLEAQEKVCVGGFVLCSLSVGDKEAGGTVSTHGGM